MTLQLPRPSKIVCVGRNYRAHAEELGNAVPEVPLLFMKPSSAIIASGQPIVRPIHMSSMVHHEGELAILIGKTLSRPRNDDAVWSAIAGYAAANDVTARDLADAKPGGRAKGFDTFCPIGEILPAGNFDPTSVRVQLLVNGVVKQDGNTQQMVHGVIALLRFIADIMTLERGDVILTGTPAGVGPLVAGDVCRVMIDGLPELLNPVVDGAP